MVGFALNLAPGGVWYDKGCRSYLVHKAHAFGRWVPVCDITTITQTTNIIPVIEAGFALSLRRAVPL